MESELKPCCMCYPVMGLHSITCAICGQVIPTPPADKPAQSGEVLNTVRELALLYNHQDNDSRQFTRHQMEVAIRHGHSLGLAANRTLTERLRVAEEEAAELRAYLEAAIKAIDAGDIYSQMCCDGHMCGCQGSSKADEFLHYARAALERKD